MFAAQNNDQSPNEYERMELDKAKLNLKRKEFQFSELVTQYNKQQKGTNMITVQSSDQNNTNVRTEEVMSDFRAQEPLLGNNQFDKQRNSARNS